MKSQLATGSFDLPKAAPEETKAFLDSYEILNINELEWPVRIYTIEPTDALEPRHEERGKIVSAMWQLKFQHPEVSRGYGFIVDIDQRSVAVPARWELPSKVTVGDYFVTEDRSFVARASNPNDHPIVLGILREAIKKHFNDERNESLGTLWQDYRGFCQIPPVHIDSDFCFCRKFSVIPDCVNGHLIVHVMITTITLDGRTMDAYYRNGNVRELAEMIEKKRANRATRKGDKVAVRVWHDERTDFYEKARAIDLTNPDIILEHSLLTPANQPALAERSISCTPFNKPVENIPLNRVRLILDAQITQEEHRETIIEPEGRVELMNEIGSFLHGMNAYGKQVWLASSPLDSSLFNVKPVLPPPVSVRGHGGTVIVIPPPDAFSERSLKARSRARSDHVRRYGFLHTRPINPVLAWPQKNDKQGIRRMLSDINYLLQKRGIEYCFSGLSYIDAEDLRRQVEDGQYDALLAVLPKESAKRETYYNMHEEIKRRVELPSQCIRIENTLPREWIDRRPREFREREPRLAKNIRKKYEVTLDNLLVKHGWLPFLPAVPFHYNVHVGLDVGGQKNDTAVAAIGCGFSSPDKGIAFRVQKIPIQIGKAEPIPTGCLLTGFRELFEYMKTELQEDVDFDSVLFIRDGAMLGHGDEWNERDAITSLHTEFLKRGFVSTDSLWSVVEVHKRAQFWRIYSNGLTAKNPLVGYSLTNFGQPNEALVCTTGRPYLTQGTASPMKLCVSDISGKAVVDNVIRDVVWEADMGFTKPDMGRGLPWILHIADAGALQLSRSYRISGITT